jgi:phosphate transport system substrate-binding protein
MKNFKKLISIASVASALCGCLMSLVSAQTLTGAGSTFVNPIMSHWIADYAKTGATINYQPVGSGAGINNLINHTVDFAGSDVPMNPTELSNAKLPVVHIPDVVGAVVVAYNLPGIGPGLHFSGDALAKIYLGQITMWNDPELVALNHGTDLPAQAIFVAHRSDGSGTTAIWTNYLGKVSSDWKNGPGEGKSIDWPVGLGGKGNAGVAGLIRAHKFSLGYIELAYAVQNDISYGLVKNSKGEFIYPSVESAAAAAAGVKLSSSNTASITDSPAKGAYPITGYSYLIVYKHSDKAADLKKFLHYVLTDGQAEDFTKPGFYAHVPDSAVAQALKAIDGIN